MSDIVNHENLKRELFKRPGVELEYMKARVERLTAEVERLRAMVPTVAPPTVENIVRRYIEANGLDGLYNEEAECGCALDDLAPCSFIGSDCLAGVKVDGCTCGEGCDFHTVAAEEGER